MKKLLIATGISIVVLSGSAYSQQSGRILAASNVKTLRPRNKFLNDINVRAMRDFINRYGDAANAHWHQTDKNYVAVFMRDSIQHRVVYTTRGDLSYVIKYYEENKMPRNVRAQIKSTYYDYKIFIVQEIECPDQPTTYVVNMQGNGEWKKVKLCQGEMEVLEDLKKGK